MNLIACAWCGKLVDAARRYCRLCGHRAEPAACDCRRCMSGGVKPGGYYGMPARGPLEPIAPQRPTDVICRRVSDYPGAKPPAAAALGACSLCGATIAFNPRAPHQDVPKVCMQCARIKPMPFETMES